MSRVTMNGLVLFCLLSSVSWTSVAQNTPPTSGGVCYYSYGGPTYGSSRDDAAERSCGSLVLVVNDGVYGTTWACHEGSPNGPLRRLLSCHSNKLVCETESGFDAPDPGGFCEDACPSPNGVNTLPTAEGCTPTQDSGSPCENGEGNPCNVATGNKYQSETDFSHAGFTFSRSYNSVNLADIGLGKGWQSNHHKKLVVWADKLIRVSSTGKGEPFQNVGGVWQGEADSKVAVVETVNHFELTNGDGSIETYTLDGQLLSLLSASGQQTTYAYDQDAQLTQITNHYGHTMGFSYLDGYIDTVTDSLGLVYRYAYDANDNLISVAYPDDTVDDTDNPKKLYHYEDLDFPNHLTGITDENGDRYATFSYADDGRAISTEHATTTNGVGQEKFSLDFDGGQ